MPNERMQKTDLTDFGIGLLAGMRGAGINRLCRLHMSAVHTATIAAFKLLESRLGANNLNFTMNVRTADGSSPQVDDIIEFWLFSKFVRIDKSGRTYLFDMNQRRAHEILEHIEGGIPLYYDVAATFVRELRMLTP